MSSMQLLCHFHILLATLFATVHAAPAALDKRVGQFAEDAPWIIQNLVIFNSVDNYTTNSTIEFFAEDTNAGIEMGTYCAYTATPGFNCDVQQYFNCQNDTMSFQWYNDQFWIQRYYNDSR